MMLKLIEKLIAQTQKNRIYVSGPMTGYPKLNRPAFNKTAAQLESYGYRVVNPASFGDGLWKHCLIRDLIMMLLFCNKIALLPGWKKSKGAQLEVSVAQKLGFRIHPRNYWFKRGRK